MPILPGVLGTMAGTVMWHLTKKLPPPPTLGGIKTQQAITSVNDYII